MFRLLVVRGILVLFLIGVSSASHAAQFLASCAPNGVLLDSELVIGYDDPLTLLTPVVIPPPAAGADVVHTFGPTTLVVAPSPSIGTSVAGPINRLPLGGGAAKDFVVGRALSEFEFSAPTGTAPDDTFRLRAFGSGSAVNAFDAAGVAADAYVAARAKAEFYNDAIPTTPPPPINCDGKIVLPPLRSLAPYENKLEIVVLEQLGGTGPITVLHTQTAGSPLATIVLQRAARYQVVLDYELRVPHGVDPPFDADVSFHVEAAAAPAVPSASWPGLAAIIAITSLIGWNFRRRLHPANETRC